MNCINPATEEVIGPVPVYSASQIEAGLTSSADGFAIWRAVPIAERGRLMKAVAGVLRRDRESLSRLMATEMGKPIAAGEQEVEKCAWTCEYFASHAAEMLRNETIATDASHSYVRYDALGPVFAIMPWNFPLWQVFRFAAPALMAGNVGLLKHAPNVPGVARAIERLFAEAGFPAGAFVNLFLSNEQAADVIAHPVVRAVTLTGSGRAGMAVAAEAGRALKKVVLELGGSDPFIVLGDVDVEQTARQAAAARTINAGQSCIAAKRFIVDRSIAEHFEYAMTQAMRALKVGDPMDRQTAVGPLARLDLLENLNDQVRRSVAAGARLVCGGKRLERKGYFYEPTILADVRPGMAAFDEETFGPVAAITACDGADDAVRLANQSRYGLGASIWTTDIARAEELAGRLEAGCVFINGTVKSDARLPFGGIKESGYGRELATPGIREFVNIKTVWVK
ncbi:MAG: succinate-semialdehyde dehdyrogenase [Phycisphaerales bacterium]|nr:succinate-semialdehyde dehdyrogenase [Phycisphaerales bacterium]